MAAAGLERFGQRPGRPQIMSQHSSSVPSTPLQHPRDIRFPSRSPSPSRGLGSQSPRSVASEAIGTQPVSRGGPGPGVCRFESGAEFRKRRIPYTEGGSDPLPAPETEPKKALEPNEDDRLSGDMRELYDRLLPSEESEERRVKLVEKLENILNEEWPGNDIKVNVFGSSGNLLSSTDSDVDVCITTPFRALESMHSLATVLHKHGMEKVVCRASAKVPIVKIWDPELELACDMNVNNPSALENTRMIKTYVQMDERVRPLAKIIKYWTKQRILNDAAFGGTISSYTWICMIINFLQLRSPPILPSLQKIPDVPRSTINGKPSPFADDLESLKDFGKANTESLGQLLFHFFRYYGYEMDYGEYVVSVKEGRLLTRKEKGWDSANYHDKEARSRLCVEEPFNTIRNLGNSADEYAFSGIHKEIRRAFDLIANGSKLNECCEHYEFPPEEKSSMPLFQRPVPKPKPILVRSASQSGKGNTGQGQGRGNNNSKRNLSNHRNNNNNNRRASSGTQFNNQRQYQFLHSPPIGMNLPDYFGTAAAGMSQDQLHNQLYKQYQYLQAQQEVLRNQLVQQQQTQAAQMQAQAQAQAQARSQDPTASPRQRPFANSLPSPRILENPPNTAPLIPGYLYHYPARYPAPSSPLSQSRSVEATATNPSSPSLATSVPSLRRSVHRSSFTEASSNASVRSQSQPGRSFPNPLTLQGMVHPGFDVSGAIGTPYLAQRNMQMYSPMRTNASIAATANSTQQPGIESAIPKDYVGYYVGQSPQLTPQYPPGGIAQTPPYREPPQAPRRLSPERLLPNGLRHQSRSPSPLGHGRSVSLSGNPRSAPLPQMPFLQPNMPLTREPEEQGPLIVNGSNLGGSSLSQRARASESNAPLDLSNNSNLGLGVKPDLTALSLDRNSNMPEESFPILANGTTHHIELSQHWPGQGDSNEAASQSTPVRPHQSTQAWQNGNGYSLHPENAPSPRVSPNARGRNGLPRLNLSPNGDGMRAPSAVSVSEHLIEVSPLNSAPLLSPVAELRTPSPTSSKGLESPKQQPQGLAKAAQIANGKLAEDANTSRQGYKVSKARDGPTALNQSINPAGMATHENSKPQALPSNQSNPWQQATRKGHKKSKSVAGAKNASGLKTGGEPIPAHEADRKGG